MSNDPIPTKFVSHDSLDFLNPSSAGKSKKGPVSCAECRRLKVACNLSKIKNPPCSSCEKRGISELCPGGSLKTGKGTRYILSGTEDLHKEIDSLRSRVRELEEALVSRTSQPTSEHSLPGSHSKTRINGNDSSGKPDESSLPMEFDALMVSSEGMQQTFQDCSLRMVCKTRGK
ncbi:hypothetical protein FS842_001058 [Serendipita sp. 407]|nr:hypothetical protein FS842_001058 [Serendipita sp. 407]